MFLRPQSEIIMSDALLYKKRPLDIHAKNFFKHFVKTL
jgi:hypothetical protein